MKRRDLETLQNKGRSSQARTKRSDRNGQADPLKLTWSQRRPRIPARLPGQRPAPGEEDLPAGRPGPLSTGPATRRPAGPNRTGPRRQQGLTSGSAAGPSGYGGCWERLVLTNLGFLPSTASSGPPAVPVAGGPFRRSPLFSLPPRPGGEDGAQ